MRKALIDWLDFLNENSGNMMRNKIHNEWYNDRTLCYPTLLFPNSITHFYKNTDSRNYLQLCEDALKIIESKGYHCISWDIPDIFKESKQSNRLPTSNSKVDDKLSVEMEFGEIFDEIILNRIQKNPNSRINEYSINFDLAEFCHLMKEYKKAKINFEIQKKLIKDNFSLILNHLWHSKMYASLNCIRADIPQKKGKSEDLLFDELFQLYPEYTKIDMQLSNYYPDIVLNILDKVFIDIEIDEPYGLIDRKELHYDGCNDNKRNDFFTNNNWFVIRFSESQILNNINACVTLIKRLVDFIMEESESLDFSESDEREGIMQVKWSKEEARNMAISKVRERGYK